MAQDDAVSHPELTQLGSEVAGIAAGFTDSLVSGRRENLPDMNRNAVSITISLGEAQRAEAAQLSAE